MLFVFIQARRIGEAQDQILNAKESLQMLKPEMKNDSVTNSVVFIDWFLSHLWNNVRFECDSLLMLQRPVKFTTAMSIIQKSSPNLSVL